MVAELGISVVGPLLVAPSLMQVVELLLVLCWLF